MEAQNDLLDRIEDLSYRVRQIVKEMAARHGLSFLQARVIKVLIRRGPMSSREVAVALGQDPSNLTAVVDWLEARGYISRTPSASDRRVKLLVPTQAAEEVYGLLRASVLDRIVTDDALGLVELREVLERLFNSFETPTGVDVTAAQPRL